MSTEIASALAEGQLLPADSSQQTATGADNQEEQTPKTFTQAELDEKVGKRLAKAERKAQGELASLRQEIEALKAAPKPNESQKDSAPKRDEFSSYEDFVEAKALHVARTEAKKELEAFKNESKKSEEDSKHAKASAEFSARVEGVIEAGRKAYPDFDATVNAAVKEGNLPTKGPLYEAIMDSDIGEKLAYHLAKNEDESERIQKLSVYGQLRELGKLEDRLSAKKEPRQTMEPVGGRTSTASGLRDDMSTDAWIKARNKQIKESR